MKGTWGPYRKSQWAKTSRQFQSQCALPNQTSDGRSLFSSRIRRVDVRRVNSRRCVRHARAMRSNARRRAVTGTMVPLELKPTKAGSSDSLVAVSFLGLKGEQEKPGTERYAQLWMLLVGPSKLGAIQSPGAAHAVPWRPQQARLIILYYLRLFFVHHVAKGKDACMLLNVDPDF